MTQNVTKNLRYNFCVKIKVSENAPENIFYTLMFAAKDQETVAVAPSLTINFVRASRKPDLKWPSFCP